MGKEKTKECAKQTVKNGYGSFLGGKGTEEETGGRCGKYKTKLNEAKKKRKSDGL